VYIGSDKRMYRLSADRTGRPHIDREMSYRNSGIPKPSQVDAGSGATPTIPPGGLVAITDNADPMDAVVYRTATRLRHHQHRVVCQVPVFAKSAGASENSLIGSGRSLSVENNYGYQDPFGPHTGAITRPGFARADINKHVNGCGLMWTNHTESAPQRGYQSSPRQPRLDRALGASASGANQSRHRRRDASQAWPLPDKGSRASAGAYSYPREQSRSSGTAPDAPDRRDRRVAEDVLCQPPFRSDEGVGFVRWWERGPVARGRVRRVVWWRPGRRWGLSRSGW
jgi:hypothetical protein